MIIRIKTDAAKAAVRALADSVAVDLTAAGGDRWNTDGQTVGRDFRVEVSSYPAEAQTEQEGGAE